MKKKIIAIIGIIVLIAASVVVIVINHSSEKGGFDKSYDTIEEANNAADFNLEYSDRLCGYLPTVFIANSSTIEAKFDGAGFIRKTLGVTDNSGTSKKYDEESEMDVNGIKVNLKGKDGKVYLATWNNNNFAYTICLEENTGGADKEIMREYIEATR